MIGKKTNIQKSYILGFEDLFFALMLRNFGSLPLQSLKKYGYCVIDNALSANIAEQLLAEIMPLQELNILYPCHTHVITSDDSSGTKSNTKLIPKSNVWELELHSYPDLQPICPQLTQWMNGNELCHAINDSNVFSSVMHFNHQTLKILFSENNGCFPLHFDTDLNLDLRRITAILYLNENTNENEGCLKLFPLLSKPVLIHPIFNRLVLFSSCFMLHRTLPSILPRYSLNLWLHSMSNEMKTDDEIEGNGDGFQMLLDFKTYLKCVAKLLYNQEWKQSIIESHCSNTADVEWLLNTHENDIYLCRKILKNSAFENLDDKVSKYEGNDVFLDDEFWKKCNFDWFL